MHINSLFLIAKLKISNDITSVTKTLNGSIFTNRPALNQLNSFDWTSFRQAQLDQIDQARAS